MSINPVNSSAQLEDRGASKKRMMFYAIGFALFLAIGALLFSTEEPSSVFVMKMCMLPLYLMATNFIGLRFSAKDAHTPWTIEFFERFLLLGICFGSFVAILLWKEDTPALSTITSFFMSGILFAGILALFDIFKKRSQKTDAA